MSNEPLGAAELLGEDVKGRPYCTYVWKHKLKFYACGYREVENQRCHLHIGEPGELGLPAIPLTPEPTKEET